MISFKQFLSEQAVGDKPDYKSIDVEQAIAILNTHCKNAVWMLKEDRPIYRGDPDRLPHAALKTSGFAAVDTTATVRKSQNTLNWYTEILDNHPDRKNFPKRSRCFIATTNMLRAYAYIGSSKATSDVIHIIPADDAKIGLVNREDMWDTRVTMFGRTEDIENWNYSFEELLPYTPASFKSLVEFDKLLKAGDKNAIKKFKSVFGVQYAETNGFLKEILNAYSERNTKHAACTTATMPHNYKGEVWVGGKVVLITSRMWEQLRNAL